ncbi:MAG: L-dehydroascorbate transporter large permease subunit [Treponema sp. RIFOXYC1_FULL_61_9]|nr:MAG: L-dehydroascorbate transporter large permease subunit [Treponema sp. GWC1_61_84]OHE76642.1 MAG: L-dehydroascorbate transporter large permease subunit [Treponema sp. RIFOXYC1_FULL_61_9]
MMLVVFLAALFGFILLSVPIAFSLLLTAFVLMMAMGTVSLPMLAQNMVRGIDSFPLMAIPFFLFAGELMNVGGISRRIVSFARALIGHVTGGLGFVTVMASMLFAGVSGSAVADTSAIGSILYPVMKREGYDEKRSAALFAAAGTIGPIIPPSIPMIIFGVMANVSIIKLFLGGIIPGVLIGIGLMIGWFVHAKKAGYKADSKFSFKVLLSAGFDAFWAMLLPVIILGGIITGIYTPTEAAVIAVVYAFFVGLFIYRELKLSMLPELLVNSAKSTAVVMLVCGAATAAAFLITTAQIPALLSGTLLKLSGSNPMLLMLYINILLLLVGCVMDLTPALLIMGPMLMPIILKFGIDPVYFGVVMIVNLCIGLITPPVGNILFVGCSIAKISVADMSKAIVPNILIMVATLFLITYVPGLVTFIPNLVGR